MEVTYVCVSPLTDTVLITSHKCALWGAMQPVMCFYKVRHFILRNVVPGSRIGPQQVPGALKGEFASLENPASRTRRQLEKPLPLPRLRLRRR